ncbi:hypothetical protein [Williamsia sp.]|uniref:hypothetical protein n=1 Tax=Williamsia sp. TaxID=1872085 RepID=UPI001A23CF87|nr:hypothetical protein [Williamsia sp.]MBJ7287572.1 hypothetical protein [Williamsia sp.]
MSELSNDELADVTRRQGHQIAALEEEVRRLKEWIGTEIGQMTDRADQFGVTPVRGASRGGGGPSIAHPGTGFAAAHLLNLDTSPHNDRASEPTAPDVAGLLAGHNRTWLTAVGGAEVLDAYQSSRAATDSSVAAEPLAEHIGRLLQDYGVNVDDLAELPPEQGAARIDQAIADTARRRSGFPAPATSVLNLDTTSTEKAAKQRGGAYRSHGHER